MSAKCLIGNFFNCYGLTKLENLNIDFTQSNKAIIYAPNGVMKSSFAKVFSDIASGLGPEDLVCKENTSHHDINFCGEEYKFDSSSVSNDLEKHENIYVINSYSDSGEVSQETSKLLLADRPTRIAYDDATKELWVAINAIEIELKEITGIAKTAIKQTVEKDIGLLEGANWFDIIEKINNLKSYGKINPVFSRVKYSSLFNNKVNGLYADKDFKENILEYINTLNNLLSSSTIINEDFTDKQAEDLGKSLQTNNLFAAGHTIRLSPDGQMVNNVDTWNSMIKNEVEKIYEDDSLKQIFSKLRKKLNGNQESRTLLKALSENKELIPQLGDIANLKKEAWLYSFSNLSTEFNIYYKTFSERAEKIRELFALANKDSEKWKSIVDLFNSRFKVPFKIIVSNKADFILNDEKLVIAFSYKGKKVADEILKRVLSTGEKRALYILFILFDMERIRELASNTDKQFLVLADDIVDSFDYMNKYAIIEYLNDFSKTPNINLLVLTHNFDFYRTVANRLQIPRNNSFIAERSLEGTVTLNEIAYTNDMFKKVFVDAPTCRTLVTSVVS